MNLQVNLPESLVAALEAQAIAAGKDIESFVIEALRCAIEDTADEASTVPLSSEQFRERLQLVIDRFPRGNALMTDSRDSIYTDRHE